MSGHVLDVAWLCLACGHRIEAGGTVYRQGDAWRCGRCAGGVLPRQERPPPKAKATPRQGPRPSRRRTLPPAATPGRLNDANTELPHVRYAKGTTLEELLRE